MSETSRTGTVEKTQPKTPTIPDRIRELMGRMPKAGFIDKRRLKSQVKDLYKGLYAPIKPFIDKKANQLGWSEAELEAFNQSRAAAKDHANKGEYAEAAQKVVDAQATANANELAKSIRGRIDVLLHSAGEMIAAARELGDQPEGAKLRRELEDRLHDLRTRRERFDPPQQLLLDAETLADDIEEKTGSARQTLLQEQGRLSQPKVSQAAEVVRLELFGALDRATQGELAACRKTVTDTVPKGALAKPEAAADRAVLDFQSAAARIISNLSDRSTLKTWDTASDEDRVKDLRARGVTALKALQDDCATFRDQFPDKVGDFVSQAKQQELSQQGEGLTRQREAFEQDYAKRIEAALSQLADLGCPELQALTADCVDMKDLVVRNDAYANADKLIDLKLQKLDAARQQLLAGVKTAGDDLTRGIKALKKDLGKNADRLDDRVKPAYQKLIDEVSQLEAVVKTGNQAAIQGGAVALERIRALGTGDGHAKLVALVTTANDLTTTGSNKAIAKEFESDANQLLLAVKTVFDTLDIYDVAKASHALELLKPDATGLTDRLLTLQNWRADVKKRLPAVIKDRNELRSLIKKKLDKPDDTTWDLDLRLVRDGYDKPGVDMVATGNALAGLEKNLPPLVARMRLTGGQDFERAKESLSKSQTTAKEKTDAAAKEVEDKRLAHAEVKTRLENYRKLLKETGTLVKQAPHGDEEELTELKTLGDQVSKRIKAGDDDGAAKQLDAIEKRLQALKDHPGGVTSKSAADLVNVQQRWAEALSTTQSNLDRIANDASKVATQLSLDPAQIQGRVTRVKESLARFNFRDPVVTLATESTPIGQRKKARETALKLIREMRSLLDSDPAVLKFEVNPFGVKKPFAKLRRFLNDVEYNALRAVPPE